MGRGEARVMAPQASVPTRCRWRGPATRPRPTAIPTRPQERHETPARRLGGGPAQARAARPWGGPSTFLGHGELHTSGADSRPATRAGQRRGPPGVRGAGALAARPTSAVAMSNTTPCPGGGRGPSCSKRRLAASAKYPKSSRRPNTSSAKRRLSAPSAARIGPSPGPVSAPAWSARPRGTRPGSHASAEGDQSLNPWRNRRHGLWRGWAWGGRRQAPRRKEEWRCATRSVPVRLRRARPTASMPPPWRGRKRKGT